MAGRKGDTAKGARLERLAKAALEAQGWIAEIAPKVIAWAPLRGGGGETRPISVRHDYFGVWDIAAVRPGVRAYFQVTTLHNLSARRNKILASGFPVDVHDAVMAYVGGRGRHFRVYWAPSFDGEWSEWKVPKAPRRRTVTGVV